MILTDNEEVKRLKSGDFSNVVLNEWFENCDFAYIDAVVEGCDKQIDVDMLNFISMYAEYLLMNSNDELEKKQLKDGIMNAGSIPANIDQMSKKDLISYWKRIVVKRCEKILQHVVLVCSRHSEYCDILERLSKNANDNVRLYCCANGKYYKFLNDSSQRIQKVAAIRANFDQKLHCADSDERKRISFLTSALKKNVIECLDGDVGYKQADKMFAMFRSMLFQGETWKDSFDRDIFYTIQDKRILADEINTLIKEGKIVFKDKFVPDCFAGAKEGAVFAKKKN